MDFEISEMTQEEYVDNIRMDLDDKVSGFFDPYLTIADFLYGYGGPVTVWHKDRMSRILREIESE